MRLRGEDKTPIRIPVVNAGSFNEVDLYSVLEKPIITFEEQQKEEENLKLKAEHAKERYLKRKTQNK